MFRGFGSETIGFLADLRANNNKEWFDANRARYEAGFVEPAKAFVVAAGEALQEFGPIEAQPKVNGSIFRINRDTRFSKDKTPYKDHLDLWFWEGERKSPLAAFFMRITPDEVGIGVGVHGFDKERLARFREQVVDAGAASLKRAVEKVEAAGWDVHGDHYKRVPSGFEPSDEFGERLIRHAALYTGEDTPHPPTMGTPEFVDDVMGRWRQQAPIRDWLVDTLG